ncbi:endoplasmic reticulum resident protein 27 [Anolis sagrei]|uniref:endoplasmic reticulum resident protein 27 n=1 Tax=Anolis sagrei TaxID=38937 RepID=UPI0035210B86
MRSSILWGFAAFLLNFMFFVGYAEEVPTSEGTVKDARKPVLLEDIAAIEAFINAAEVVVIGFFKDLERPEVSEFRIIVQNIPEVPFAISNSSQVLSHYNVTRNTISLFREVDNKRQDVEIEDIKGLDADKLSRFVRANELRWVTEYNPMTAVGLFESVVETHLLLLTNKSSPMHTERMNKYREAAKLFQGKLLFILVDILAKGNDRVMSYFHLKKSQLPALAAYHTPDEEQEVLSLDDISVEIIKEFCDGFLQKLQAKEKLKTEDNVLKEEL